MKNPAFGEAHGPTYGELLGPWRVLELLDYGTYGSVYRASLADRPEADAYALKLAHHPGDARFEREAELLSRARHPHVPRYHGRGVWRSPQGENHPFVVMQLIEGEPLYAWARRRSLTNRLASKLLSQVASALEAVHQHGVHRDVKGDNVLVDRQGRAVLVDFGMGYYPEARALTDSAIPPGTEQYRSHQLLRFRYHFRRVSEAHYQYRPEDDVYALGVMAYRLVTGAYPPAGTDPECEDDPERARPARLLPPSELASVSPELERLILQMLSEEPEARGTAGELAQAFEKAAKGAGTAGDKPILPSSSMLPTERTEHPGPRQRRTVLAWGAWTSAVAVSALLVSIGLGLLHWPERVEFEPSPLVAEVVQEPENPDAGPVDLADAGVGSQTLASASDVPQAAVPIYAIADPLPKQPFPGQRKPPCRPYSEVVLLGACWTRIDLKPPCRGEGFEVDGKCVIASFNGARGPTSEQP